MEKLEKLSDSELIKISKNGQRNESLETLYNRHFNGVYSFSYKLTKDKESAGDLAHDTFYKAFKALEKDNYQEENNFKAWLITITKNNFINNYRKNAKMPRVKLEDCYDSCLYQKIREEQNPEKIAETKNRNEILRKEIKKLPDIYEKAFSMHFLDELSYKEIAEVLGIPLFTVKTRIFYARKKVIKVISSEYPEFMHNL